MAARSQLNSIWSSSGTLAQSGGTLYLGGNFSLADWGSVSGTNGTIYLSGTLSNTNTTLTLDAASGSWVLQGGAVYGGSDCDDQRCLTHGERERDVGRGDGERSVGRGQHCNGAV